MSQQPIVRPIEILKGVEAIAKRLGIGETTVRKLCKIEGCPAIPDGAGVRRCDAAEMWEFYKENRGRVE
jgi:predicted transcriptional regulator